VNEEEMRQ